MSALVRPNSPRHTRHTLTYLDIARQYVNRHKPRHTSHPRHKLDTPSTHPRHTLDIPRQPRQPRQTGLSIFFYRLALVRLLPCLRMTKKLHFFGLVRHYDVRFRIGRRSSIELDELYRTTERLFGSGRTVTPPASRIDVESRTNRYLFRDFGHV